MFNKYCISDGKKLIESHVIALRLFKADEKMRVENLGRFCGILFFACLPKRAFTAPTTLREVKDEELDH